MRFKSILLRTPSLHNNRSSLLKDETHHIETEEGFIVCRPRSGTGDVLVYSYEHLAEGIMYNSAQGASPAVQAEPVVPANEHPTEPPTPVTSTKPINVPTPLSSLPVSIPTANAVRAHSGRPSKR